MFFILFLWGILAGTVSAFFGVGGGVIAVPVMYSLFPELHPVVVISSATGIVLFVASTNFYNFFKVGFRPEKKAVILMAISTIFIAILASYFVQFMQPKTLKVILGIYYVIVCVQILFGKIPDKKYEQDWNFSHANHMIPKLILTGMMAGIVAGFTGLGGGTVLVPAYAALFKMPFSLLSPYSNTIMIFGALGNWAFNLAQTTETLPATYSYLSKFQIGKVNFYLVFGIYAGAFLGSKLGVKLTKKTSDKFKKYSFGIILLFLGIKSLFF